MFLHSEGMKWFAGNIATAIQVSKKNAALLIVFVESANEKGKEMKELWDKVSSFFKTLFKRMGIVFIIYRFFDIIFGYDSGGCSVISILEILRERKIKI